MPNTNQPPVSGEELRHFLSDMMMAVAVGATAGLATGGFLLAVSNLLLAGYL